MLKPFVKKFQVISLLLMGDSYERLKIEADEARIYVNTDTDGFIEVFTEREYAILQAYDKHDATGTLSDMEITYTPGLFIKHSNGWVNLHSVQNGNTSIGNVSNDLTGHKEEIQIHNYGQYALNVFVELVHYVPADEIGISTI